MSETRKLGEEAVVVMKKHGLVVHPVPSDVMSQWERSAHATYPRLIREGFVAEYVKEMEVFRNEYRARQNRE
jgi:hypothetical protein